jgi:hypothetical protein
MSTLNPRKYRRKYRKFLIISSSVDSVLEVTVRSARAEI